MKSFLRCLLVCIHVVKGIVILKNSVSLEAKEKTLILLLMAVLERTAQG